MLAVILAEDDAFFRAVAHRSRLHKYTVVRYRDPVKLADSLQELHPDALIVRSEDYPLHWEILAAELLCLNNMGNVKTIVFSTGDVDPGSFFRNLHCVNESPGDPDSGSLSSEAAKALSSLLSVHSSLSEAPDVARGAFSGEADGAHGVDKKSRLMSAVEKQAQGSR
jgi:hypothetical protein